MLTGREFTEVLSSEKFDFSTGVPCSLIDDLIRELEISQDIQYVASVREDVAVGLAAGAWLAGRQPVVLMQNSGLGTSLNALASLSLMYGLPLLAIVTWRGHRGVDAPEHVLTGSITESLLTLLGIPYRVLANGSAGEDVAWAAAEMKRRLSPVVLVVPPKLFVTPEAEDFAPHETAVTQFNPSPRLVRQPNTPAVSRATALRAAIEQLTDEPVIHANGYISRESHAIADRARNFYMLGSMGLTSAIGLGLALARPAEATVVFDGDGNLLMNLGILPMVGTLSPRSYVHCVFDNGVYGSTGNQRSAASGTRFDELAAAAGYRTATTALSEEDVRNRVATALRRDGPHLILIKVTTEMAEVPRIAHTPAQIRDRFRASLGNTAAMARRA